MLLSLQLKTQGHVWESETHPKRDLLVVESQSIRQSHRRVVLSWCCQFRGLLLNPHPAQQYQMDILSVRQQMWQGTLLIQSAYTFSLWKLCLELLSYLVCQRRFRLEENSRDMVIRLRWMNVLGRTHFWTDSCMSGRSAFANRASWVLVALGVCWWSISLT